MKALANPYAPGAGYPPPELAGRDGILDEAGLAIKMSRAGKPARSVMLVGLRGVGKTVLLNEIQSMADREGAFTDFIEVSKNEPLSVVIIAKGIKVLAEEGPDDLIVEVDGSVIAPCQGAIFPFPFTDAHAHTHILTCARLKTTYVFIT